MKKMLMLLVLVSLMFEGVVAQNMKIGVVDSRAIMSKVKKFKDAQNRLNKQIAKEEQRLSNMKKNVEKMYAELDQQKMILSEAKRKEKEGIVKQKYMELQSEMQKIYGPQGKLEQERAKLAAPLLKEIKKVIDQIAKKDRYDVVLDSGVGVVLYHNPRIDLTQKIIDVLNKKK